jgi:hypothetical protein
MDEMLNLWPGWKNYWAEEGAVIQLVYLTPDPRDCTNDSAAYNELTLPAGIAQLSLATRIGLKAAPGSGHMRISDRVFAAWVVVVKAGRLGDMVSEYLNPCQMRNTSGQYKLSGANRVRASTNAASMLFAKGNDKLEHVTAQPSAGAAYQAGKQFGEKIDEKVNDTLKEGAADFSKLFGSFLSSLIVPGIIAFAVYKVATSSQRVAVA